MPRKNPLPERELKISARLRDCRASLGYPRRLFASRAGLDSSIIVRIELGRMPVQYEVARHLCLEHSINPIWLATGKGAVRMRLFLPRYDELGVGINALFSEVFDQHLERRFIERERFALFSLDAIIAGRVSVPTGKEADKYVEYFHQGFDELFGDLPQAGKEKLLALAVRTLAKFGADWELGNHKTPGENIAMIPRKSQPQQSKLPPAKNISKLTVDNPPPSGMVPVVSSEIPTWKQIVAALKRLTKPAGAKAQLAKDLKTSRQNVNKWLSSSGAPSAKLTLEVFRWVEGHGGWQQK